MDFSKNMHIQFPINNGQRYYKIHYEFVHRVFEAGSAQIELKQIPMVNTSNFKCKIDGKDVIFCFSDDNNSFGINDPELNNIPVFKFHYGQGNLFGNNVFILDRNSLFISAYILNASKANFSFFNFINLSI